MGNLEGIGKDLVLLGTQFAHEEIAEKLRESFQKYELSDNQIARAQLELIVLRLSMVDFWLDFAFENRNISDDNYQETVRQVMLEEGSIMGAFPNETLFEHKRVYSQSYHEDFSEWVDSKDDDFLFVRTANVMIKQLLGQEAGLGTEGGLALTMIMARFISDYCKNIFAAVTSVLKERQILRK